MADRLYECRLATRALMLVLDRYELRGIALQFNPDDPSQVFAGMYTGLNEHEVGFYEDFKAGAGKPLAGVLLNHVDGHARVVIDRIEDLVRRNRRVDFRAAEIGIIHRAGQPDVDLDVDMNEVIQSDGEILRNAKRRPFPSPARPATPPASNLGFRMPR